MRVYDKAGNGLGRHGLCLPHHSMRFDSKIDGESVPPVPYCLLMVYRVPRILPPLFSYLVPDDLLIVCRRPLRWGGC
jgi:hypothetical protein